MNPIDLPNPPPPRDDDWKPDPVLEARRQELVRRFREEGYRPTYDDIEGILADLWASDEEFEEFLRFNRRDHRREG